MMDGRVLNQRKINLYATYLPSFGIKFMAAVGGALSLARRLTPVKWMTYTYIVLYEPSMIPYQ